MVADPHGWNSWQSYKSAHESKLAQYADHFLIENRLTYEISPELIYWEGELICADGIEIHVRSDLTAAREDTMIAIREAVRAALGRQEFR